MSAQKTFKASVQATKIDDMDAQEAMSASRTEGESDITEAVSEIDLNKKLNLVNNIYNKYFRSKTWPKSPVSTTTKFLKSASLELIQLHLFNLHQDQKKSVAQSL